MYTHQNCYFDLDLFFLYWMCEVPDLYNSAGTLLGDWKLLEGKLEVRGPFWQVRIHMSSR